MMYSEDNIGYLKGRLEGTIIRMTKCGTPILVNNIHRQGRSKNVLMYVNKLLYGHREWSLEEDSVLFKDTLLKSPILGNVNTRRGSIFLARKPLRHDWRQGLRPSNVSCKARGHVGLIGLQPSYIAQSIHGDFPTFEVALQQAIDNRRNVAFSRKFSIDKEKNLWYKESKVVGNVGTDRPTLENNFFWLKEMLDADAKG